MKSLLKLAVASMLCVGLFAHEAMALDAVPHQINVQGVLRNVAGEVVSGTYAITFSIYDAQYAGTVLYSEPQSLTVTGGVFNTQIGPVPTTVFVNKSAAFLEVKVGTDAALPRQVISAVGFAFQAEHAEVADELSGAAPDLACTGCVGATEVSFNWALGVSAGGGAANVVCVNCVGGGATGDIATETVTTENIKAGTIAESDIASAAISNRVMGADAIYTGNIMNGQVQGVDLADGAVGTGKLAAGVVGNTELGVLYALSDAKGGPALDVKCSSGTGCVGLDEVTFLFAKGVTKNGDAAGLNCSATPCVSDSEVTFNYAGAGSHGGAALDLSCTSCVESAETNFGWAAAYNNEKGGAAANLTCTNCVDSGEVAFNYAASATKGGGASDVACTSGCISAAETGFNWAAGDSLGGAATGLNCTGCVNTSDLGNGQVTNDKVGTGIAGSKITVATATDLGVVKIGAGLSVDGTGLVTPNFGSTAGTISEGNHTHTDYVRNGLDDFNVGKGKKINFLDPGDNPGGHYAYFSQPTADSSNTSAVRLTLGYEANANEYFEIYTESATSSGQKHRFEAGGAAYHSGALTLGGALTCTGCVGSTSLLDGSVGTLDIANGTISGDDLAANLSLTTTGNVSATNMYANVYYDKNDTAYYADPNGTSIMSTIRYVGGIKAHGNTDYGLDGYNLYIDTISSGSAGDALQIQYNKCGDVQFFYGSCGGQKVQINGEEHANIWYDRQDTAYYMDPNASTKLKYLNTYNDSWLPYTNGTNYIRGTTYAFNGPWYDENSTTYYVDPASNSRFNVLYSNGARFYNSWPGDPSGFAQVANSGGHLYLGPDSASSERIIMRQGGSDRIVFMLNGNASTGQPSFRTNGNYLVINPGTGDKNIYMLWDTGGTVNVNGGVTAENLVDRTGSGCIADPSYHTRLTQLYSNQFSAHQAYILDGLRVDGQGIRVVGNGGQDTGIRMHHWATIAPETNAASSVGMSSRAFWGMWSYNFVTVSQRSMKKNIEYYDRNELAKVGEKLHNFKPVKWFYNEEVLPSEVTEDSQSAMVRANPHVGLILDEMPVELSDDGKGWYLNDSVGFLLIAGKYLEDKNREQSRQIRDLEDRLATLEQILVDSGLYR